MSETPRHLAYFSAQAIVQGQDSWAAVIEITTPIERSGWTVDLFFPKYEPDAVPGIAERLRRIAGAQWRLARVVRSYDALYVRVHPLAWPVAAYANQRGVPVIQESNGSWEDALMAWPGMRRIAGLIIWMQRAQYRHAAAIISVSETLAEWLREVTGRDDVVVSPNGANDELFRPGAPRLPGLPERYVAFFGQFAPWQRIETLLAAAELPEWPEGVDLLLAGDGQLRPVVEDAAARNPHIHYLDVLPYAEVPGLVANAMAATVLTYAPDRAGYSPLKLYESMSCGVPVICSDTPGQAEYVRAEEAGIVVPPEDPLAVAQAAAQLAGDPAAAAEMGARGRRAVEERYSWRARARQRQDVIERAIKARSA
ncbi:MAG: glycosyltransferase family 4 protein [Coriobacteriia bacterium]|nr:glycosyltransferase family 4 protein [Coriobacteriia bacterium]